MNVRKNLSLGFFALGLSLPSPLAAGRPARMAAEFPLKEAPNRADWHAFMQASDEVREQMWSYQTNRGLHLQDWAWGWRLGWVRVCGRSQVAFCGAVLQEALIDKALVVRAEAASALGSLYDGQDNKAAVRLLTDAYHNHRNQRRGKALYVQNRILFALHRIGGEASVAGKTLAAEGPEQAAYWQRLEDSGR